MPGLVCLNLLLNVAILCFYTLPRCFYLFEKELLDTLYYCLRRLSNQSLFSELVNDRDQKSAKRVGTFHERFSPPVYFGWLCSGSSC